MDKIKYVVTSGCSFSEGQCMYKNQSPLDKSKHRFSKIFADNIGAQDINLAGGGGSNKRAFRKVYEWIQSNKEKVESTFFIFGITDLSRTETKIDSNILKLNTSTQEVQDNQFIRWNNHISFVTTDIPKMFEGISKDIQNKMVTWHHVEYSYMFEESDSYRKLFMQADLLQTYIKSLNSNITYFYALPKSNKLDSRLNWYKPGGHNYWLKYVEEYRRYDSGHPNKEDHMKLGMDLTKTYG